MLLAKCWCVATSIPKKGEWEQYRTSLIVLHEVIQMYGSGEKKISTYCKTANSWQH